MYRYEDYQYHRDEELWRIEKKIGTQTVRVEFQEFPNENHKVIFWNICLVCFNKRKNIDRYLADVTSTGKCGVKGLLFAKQAIVDFENNVISEYQAEYNDVGHIIYCTWLDNQRRRVYERGLKSLGYDYGMIDGRKALMKKVDF